MSVTTSVKLAFPKGKSSFSIYSAKLDLAPFEYAHIHPNDKPGKLIRITLYKTLEEAKKWHGKAVRKLYMTEPPSTNGVTRQYRTLSGPTREILGFDREKDFKFRGVEVPAILLKEGETFTTIDVDITGKNIADLLKMGRRSATATKEPAAAKVAKEVPMDKVESAASKSVTETKEVPAKSTTRPVDPTQARKLNQLSLPASATLDDLKRMGFKVMVMDSDDNPFMIEAK